MRSLFVLLALSLTLTSSLAAEIKPLEYLMVKFPKLAYVTYKHINNIALKVGFDKVAIAEVENEEDKVEMEVEGEIGDFVIVPVVVSMRTDLDKTALPSLDKKLELNLRDNGVPVELSWKLLMSNAKISDGKVEDLDLAILLILRGEKWRELSEHMTLELSINGKIIAKINIVKED